MDITGRLEGTNIATVELDIDNLTAARTAMSGLANGIDSQRHRAGTGTPIPLDTLSDGGPLSRTSRWLLDQVAPFQRLIDLAKLLDVDHKGQVSYDGTGSVDETTKLLSEQIANGLKDIGDVDSLEDRERLSALTEIFGRYANDPNVAGPVVSELGPEGTIDALHQLRGLVQIDGTPPYYIADGLEQTEEVETINKLQDNLAASLAIAVGSAARAGQLSDDFGKQMVEHSGDGWAIGTLFHYGDLNHVDFGKQLLVSSGEELLDREQNLGWQQWQVNQHMPTRFGVDVRDDTLVDDPTLQWLKVLDNNADASQTILLDEDRAEYLLGEREAPYEDPPGDAAGDVLRAATIDQAMDPGTRGKNAAEISSHVIDHFGGEPSPLDGVKDDLGGIVATYIADVDRTAQAPKSAEQAGTYSGDSGLPNWVQHQEMLPWGITIDRNDLIGVLNDVGDDNGAASAIGNATTDYNQLRLTLGAQEAFGANHTTIGGNDPLVLATKNSAQFIGFMQDGLINGDYEDAEGAAEDRRDIAEFFTLPLDAIPTAGTGPLGGYVVGQIKDSIVVGYTGDGVQESITHGNQAFGEASMSTRLQAWYTVLTTEGPTGEKLPSGPLVNDWPTEYGKPVPPGGLTDEQISRIMLNGDSGGGYSGVLGTSVDGAIRDLNLLYGDS